jgi:tRNA(Ile)-lysidine synthase
LRHWLPGDVFQPLGMDGKHQKLQDFFTNQKHSRYDKDKTWILVNGDGAIIWVLGFRPDERFKIRPDSSKGLKINYIELA